MNHFIGRANIDRCLELLDDRDLSAERRSAISKALIDEENKLSRGLEHLEFAESRAAACRERLKRLRSLRNRFREGSLGRTQAETMIENYRTILQQAEKLCGLMRKRLRENQLSALQDPAKDSNIHRSIPYSIEQSSDADIWTWEFRVGGILRRGKTKTRLYLLAEHRVRMLIDRELKMVSKSAGE